ncbi:MAG: glycosyltransferase family 4 protein [Bryobacterales bacterium]|nr:glycosyltransferase family 4 protein [Bryobacterales bacterium]
MNILYIDHYAGSVHHGMEFRPFYMARQWQKLSHKVTVVAGSYSHLRQVNPEVQDAWTEESIDGIDFIWLRAPKYQGNGLKRMLSMLCFVLALFRHSARILQRCKPDAIIASSTYPFDIFPARRMARAAGARLIFELHDLWPLSPMELGGMSPWHPFIVLTQFGQDYVCRHADAIVSMLPKADQHLRSRGMPQEKFNYIPNGVVLEEWSVAAPNILPDIHHATIEKLRDRFIVMYAGAHGLLNNLQLIIRAAESLRAEEISFVLVGQGPEKAALQQQAQAAGLENVHFLPPVPKEAVPRLLAMADVLLLSFAPQPLFRFGVSPNKLMDYMMAAKPILAAMRAGNNLVEEHQCGITTDPDDPEALALGVRRLRALSAEERATLGASARQAAEHSYSYEVLAKRFEQVLTSL